jgi:hypothetical protein
MNLDVTPVFTKNYASEKKIKINRGGTRSSKTRSIAQIAVLWLFTGQISRNKIIPVGVWSTVRKYSTTLDATVIACIITKLISYRCCHCFFRNFLFHLLKT